MKRALPLLAALAGCSLRDPRVTASSCTSAGQCSQAHVCFLGECRTPAANLSVVGVEVRPPSSSQFAVRRQQIDVRQSVLNDFLLSVPFTADGGVRQDQTGGTPAPVPAGAVVTFTDHAPAIRDRVEQVSAVTDANGRYSARIPQGTWDVVVQMPAQSPPQLPPVRLSVLLTSAPVVDLLVPAAEQFPRLDGGLTVDDGGTAVAGASVTALDSQGAALSSASLSDADGGYIVVLPPGASPSPLLQIGPPGDLDGGVPATLALDPFPTYPKVAYSAAIDLPLSPVVTLTGRVTDLAGKPVPSARVYVRTAAGMSWTLARATAVDSNGVYGFALRASDYMIEAVPSPDGTTPAISPQQTLTLFQATTLDLSCPPKVLRRGQVVGPDGRAVGANFQITATRLNDGLIAGRTAVTVPTDANGVYRLAADGGRWRLEVVPPTDSTLPRKIFQVDLDPNDPGESALSTVQISPALVVVGTVRGSSGSGPTVQVADALINFFSLDSNQTSVFLASARTDAQGRYTAILPDVAQPGLGP
jgi:hypothetical protein